MTALLGAADERREQARVENSPLGLEDVSLRGQDDEREPSRRELPGQPQAERELSRVRERVGDVALVMRGRYTVKDWTPGEPRHLHIGNHGGTSEDEMMIPLIVETT